MPFAIQHCATSPSKPSPLKINPQFINHADLIGSEPINGKMHYEFVTVNIRLKNKELIPPMN